MSLAKESTQIQITHSQLVSIEHYWVKKDILEVLSYNKHFENILLENYCKHTNLNLICQVGNRNKGAIILGERQRSHCAIDGLCFVPGKWICLKGHHLIWTTDP